MPNVYLARSGIELNHVPRLCMGYAVHVWDRFREMGSNACFFQDFNFFDRSLKCLLHIASYALRIEVLVMEL